MRNIKFLITSGAAMLFSATFGQAALTVTNGTFGTTNNNGATVGGGGWFESGTANWVEGSWLNGGLPTVFTTGPMLLFDGSSTTPTVGWLYQSLGTLSAGDISQGTFTIKADFGEKADGWTNDAVFTVYAGNFTGATGTDIASGGLTTLSSINLNAASQGLTAAYGNSSRANGITVGTFNVSSQPVGTEIWLRISESRIANPGGTGAVPSNGDLLIDNVVVIPEPATAVLSGLSLLALLRRRRQNG